MRPERGGAQLSCLPVPCSLGWASGSPRVGPGAGAEADVVQTLWSQEFGGCCSQHSCLGARDACEWTALREVLALPFNTAFLGTHLLSSQEECGELCVAWLPWASLWTPPPGLEDGQAHPSSRDLGPRDSVPHLPHL